MLGKRALGLDAVDTVDARHVTIGNYNPGYNILAIHMLPWKFCRPQVKRELVSSTTKLLCSLLHELSNDLRPNSFCRATSRQFSGESCYPA